MRRDAGFTLVELMVALALLATVAALAFGTLRTGIRVWDRNAETVPPRLLAERLRGLIEGAVLAPVPGPDLSRRAPFLGTAEGLAFLRAEETGLTAWRIALAAEGAGSHITIWRRRVARPAELFALTDWGTPYGEVGGLSPARLAYLGRDGLWREAWDGGALPPQLIRLRLERRPDPLDIVLAPGGRR